MKTIVIHNAKDLRIDDDVVRDVAAGEVEVKIAVGGVCGSDLHYYNHGGFGAIRLKEPMILGHEVAGIISQVGADVSHLAVGDHVAVSPSRPCGACVYCATGRHNHCLNMRFYGSAMPFPHIQGAFRERLVASAKQCTPTGNLSLGEAAMAEPLAVVLHGVRRAGEMVGKKVLVTGCGPIGILCLLAARRAGAVEIVMTDIAENALLNAHTCGADRVINTKDEPELLAAYGDDKGYFDVMFECTGAAPALIGGLTAVRPRAVIVQLGMGGDMPLPMVMVTAKELDLRGSFRFHEEFATGIAMMKQGLIDVKPLISHTVPLEDAEQAFLIASDPLQPSLKTQIQFFEG